MSKTALNRRFLSVGWACPVADRRGLSGRLIVGFAVGLSFCLFSGCASLGPSERQVLTEAATMYGRGQTTAAKAKLDPVIRDFYQAIEISEAYYVRGLCRFKDRELRASSEDFELAIKKTNRRDLAARCHASLATIAYQRADWPRAADLYEKALADLPNQPPTDAIRYAAGTAMQRCGRWRKAKLQFGRILLDFRQSPIAADARRMAGWNHEYYSIQLGVFENADNAARAVRRYREQGLDALQENHRRMGKAMWVVMVGRYPTYADARSALEWVRKKQPDACIIP